MQLMAYPIIAKANQVVTQTPLLGNCFQIDNFYFASLVIAYVQIVNIVFTVS